MSDLGIGLKARCQPPQRLQPAQALARHLAVHHLRQLVRQEQTAAQKICASPASRIFQQPERLGSFARKTGGAARPMTVRANKPSPGTPASAPKRRRQRGTSTKLGYPPRSSSPPSPEIATLRPASLAALETNQVFTPSIDGWSIASRIAGRSLRRTPARLTLPHDVARAVALGTPAPPAAPRLPACRGIPRKRA